MRTLGDFPNLTAAMEHEGWPETKIRKIMGENWLRFLADVETRSAGIGFSCRNRRAW
jgi:microsomal dipeptidase-like Zn-dependent dipeptidase